MRILASALLGFAALASVAGCIPIGVRGSTFAAAPASSCAGPALDDSQRSCVGGGSDQPPEMSTPLRV